MEATPHDACSKEDFDYFMSSKHLLAENALDGKLFKAKSSDSTVGLVNHGSTCYLNSILQCLLQNKPFLKALFSSNDAETACLRELKKLFTFLTHSIRNSVGTKGLLASFGWNESQIHDQHDAQEFFGILLDALSASSKQLEGLLQDVFRGGDAGKIFLFNTVDLPLSLFLDVIQCTECQFEKTNDSFFQNLSVEVPDHLEGKPADSVTHSLNTLLCDLLKNEVLDENNRWECSSCNRKVCANRRHIFKTLPETLAIHLKRFRFDPV
jgi:ubiquitin C-terminal hydrolase